MQGGIDMEKKFVYECLCVFFFLGEEVDMFVYMCVYEADVDFLLKKKRG